MSRKNIKINRRDFLKWAALVATGITVSANLGCEGNGDDDSSMDTDDGVITDRSGNIASNPEGHTVTLTVAQQEAGNAVTLTLTSGAGHTHTVEFSAEEVQNVAIGGSASNSSSINSGHNHTVTFS